MSSPRVLLLLVTLSHLLNHFNATAITFLVSLVIALQLGLSNTEVGLVAAAAQLTSGFLQLSFGVSARYYAKRILLATGNGMMGLASILTGVATNVSQLLAFRLIWGVGAAPQHPVGASLISDNFEGKLRGRALGIHSGLAYVGNVAGPAAALAVSELVGWRNALFTLAVPMLIIMVPLFAWIREGATQLPNGSTHQGKLGASLLRASKDRNVMLITLAQAVLAGGRGLGVTLVFLPIFLTQKLGLDKSATALFSTVFLVGGSLGPLLYGWLSDHLGRKPVAILAILTTGALTYSITLLKEGGLSLGATLFVLGSVSFAVTSILQAYLSETTDPSIRDIAFGLYFTLGFGVTSIWTIIIGSAIDFYGFTGAFTLMAAFSAPATAFLLLVSEKRQPTMASITPHAE